MKRLIIALALLAETPATFPQDLPLGAESRADELRQRRGEPDIARQLERERIRLEIDRFEHERARLRLERDRVRREHHETLSRERSLR